MLNRLITILVTIPAGIILVALAVANRGNVAVTLDPFNPGNAALTAQVPLFVLVFSALILGIILGGMVTWFKQGKHRKTARVERSRAAEIQAEAEALKAERKAAIAAANGNGLALLAKP